MTPDSDNASVVHAGYRFPHDDTTQVRIRGEAFRQTPTVGRSSERTGDRTYDSQISQETERQKSGSRLTIDKVVPHEVELATRSLGLILNMLTIPSHRQSITHRETRNVILVVDTSKPILVLERSPGEVTTVDVSTSDQRDLLGSGELRSECFRFLISIIVDSKVDCKSISIVLSS